MTKIRNENDYKRLNRIVKEGENQKGKRSNVANAANVTAIQNERVNSLSVLNKIKGFYGNDELRERRLRTWSKKPFQKNQTIVSRIKEINTGKNANISHPVRSMQLVNLGKIERDRGITRKKNRINENAQLPETGSYTRIGIGKIAEETKVEKRVQWMAQRKEFKKTDEKPVTLGLGRSVPIGLGETVKPKKRWLCEKNRKKENTRENRLTMFITVRRSQNGTTNLYQQLNSQYRRRIRKRRRMPMQTRGRRVAKKSVG